MIDSPDDAIVITPPETADASVIWLHGLGADGRDFEPIVPELGAANTRRVRYVFPNAPQRPVTINSGYVMRAWYDVYDMDLTRRPDEAGIRESEQLLRAYVEAERGRGIPAERIVLAGFSQGGAVALHTGLRYEHRLAGILALSTYLPMPEATREEVHDANRDVPLFMGHGTYDPVIPLRQGESSRLALEAMGYDVDWHSYPMEHSVSLEEIRDIAAWLGRVIGQAPAA